MIWSSLWPDGSEGAAPPLAPHQEHAVEWIDRRLELYGGAILADEPGLGKSWVAATVVRERIRRGESAELIVPASLRSMWKEVRAAFSIEATIVTHEVVRRGGRSADEADFIVVDEAHRFRNEGTRGWNRLGRRLIGTRALFLTATPIWNAPSDLLALLRLLVADDVLRRSGLASIELGLGSEEGRARIVDQLVLRRNMAVLETDLFPGALHRRTVRYAIPESWSIILDRIESLRFPHSLGTSTSILAQLMIRRLHSSEAALRSTLERQLRFCRTGLDLLRDGYHLNRREFTSLFVVEDLVQEILFPQLFLEPDDEPDADALRDEIDRIEAILALLRGVDSPKRDRLIDEVIQTRVPSLIFVAAVDTARELFEHLSSLARCGVATGAHCRARSGGTTIGELTEAFQSGRIDHLILTDLGGEGLNLQRADRVIHYDLPWSPMRVEQRNGRARRIGRDGRSLEVITFQPEDGHLPTLEAVELKRRAHDAFWRSEGDVAAEDASLERLPSRLTGAQPQSRLWRHVGRELEPQWLLRRHRSSIEHLMSEADTAQQIAELVRLIRLEEARETENKKLSG